MAGSAGVADPHRCASSVRHQTSAAQTGVSAPDEVDIERLGWNALRCVTLAVFGHAGNSRADRVRLRGGSYDTEPRSCLGVGASGEGWKDLCLCEVRIMDRARPYGEGPGELGIARR